MRPEPVDMRPVPFDELRTAPVEGLNDGLRQAQPASLDHLSETGERIDSLLSALGTAGPVAQQRGEDLVAVVGEEAYPIVEIAPKSGFYDYEAKYTKGKTDYTCPAKLPCASRS